MVQLTADIPRAGLPSRLFGAELHIARDQAGLSLAGLAAQYRAEGRVVHRGYLANVEKGERLPNDRQFAEIADDLLATGGLLARLWDYADEARLSVHDEAHRARAAAAELAASTMTPFITGDIVFVPYISAADTVAYMRMSRRAFLATGGLATASLTSGLFHRDELATADAIASDILSGDPRRVATEQTSHVLDLTIAAHIAAGGMRPNPLLTWIAGAPDPVLRVNAAGIAAKMPGSDAAESAVTALAADPPMRHRYLTAVVSRVLGTPWSRARRHTADPRPGHHVTAASVDLLRTELHNEHDAGARWCTAYLLADIWAIPEHPANASAATALETALADESLPMLRTAYGRALSRKALVG